MLRHILPTAVLGKTVVRNNSSVFRSLLFTTILLVLLSSSLIITRYYLLLAQLLAILLFLAWLSAPYVKCPFSSPPLPIYQLPSFSPCLDGLLAPHIEARLFFFFLTEPTLRRRRRTDIFSLSSRCLLATGTQLALTRNPLTIYQVFLACWLAARRSFKWIPQRTG